MNITDTVTANFTTWGDLVAGGDSAKVADLYSDQFSLLPTMAAEVIATREACEGYFSFFCALQPTVQILQEYIEPMGDTAYVHSGVYRFTIGPDTERDEVDARFSMVWKKETDGWRIVHHHSSRFPVA